MKDYPNFYENIDEARNRVSRTFVLYDGQPYYIAAITDNKPDDIFRVWLVPLVSDPADAKVVKEFMNLVSMLHTSSMADKLDEFYDKNKGRGIMRKHMNSPKFNRFRPYPLGMCNVGTQTYYLERQPTRPSMHQGLTPNGVFETLVTAGSRTDNPRHTRRSVEMMSGEFKDCVLGDHHSPHEVLKQLLNPAIANDAHAFHREFALVRGPIGMLFLGYRTDIIGVLQDNDFASLKLGREYRHCREVVEELRLFDKVH